jgi:hypothetical protein
LADIALKFFSSAATLSALGATPQARRQIDEADEVGKALRHRHLGRNQLE